MTYKEALLEAVERDKAKAYDRGRASVVPASVFDEVGFLGWADTEIYELDTFARTFPPARKGAKIDALTFYDKRKDGTYRAAYDSVEAVAAAYVAARDATKDEDEL